MKRFEDDVPDNPLFKRSFGSSPRESYGQSQVLESGLGGRGSGTRRASKDEGGSSASKFDFEQAISLVNKIKKRLENDHDYKSFINILSMYRKENKDIKEVYHEVAIILNEHPDLLDECTMFLLNSSTNLDNNKTLMRLHKEQKKTRAEKENMGKRTHNEDYKEPDNQNKDALKCEFMVANTLGKYPELMEGFNEFIERYERVVEFLAKWDEEQDNDQDEDPPQRINLEEVVTFVKKVKERFQNDDHVYKSFLDILKMYKEEQNKNINDVYHEVAICLKDHPDLLDDFTKYLPESSLPMLKLYLHQLTIFFSSL
ncbi:hypothetical protein KY290_008177 [Solanum tuberosum]|uniref:Paired amphipathic helix protein Sin3-like 2 n=1 Tax=Solanum tuberosum TaxID=4113 RepID=A0ABQ7W7L4_SOLTU|nr:hypothetical protein KY290_008177 [Solanum tuberosum]